MGEHQPRKRSRQHFETHPTPTTVLEAPFHGRSKWYFTREEIECFSPSRKDGIDLEKESYLRASYCMFLQRLGVKLRVSQATTSCAMVLCHRFYMCQSHAKNDWRTIATASLFFACKTEDEPCQLSGVVVAAYEIIYEWDPSAPTRIHQREYYHEFKELILVAERLLLDTIAFDLDIELPYKPLAAALNKLNVRPDVATAAWNLVNDWFRTMLLLQYKPHVIAIVSLRLAAVFHKSRLGNRRDWWSDFCVTKVIHEIYILEMERRHATPPPTREFVWPLQPAGKPVHMARTCAFHGCHSPPHRQPSNW
ncbi:PREDICTED: cyclin-T1-3-like isoform X2 [Tarenaya hassleriana]|uniref:cyclin-T1-3-like isoform X2 n=1 Tax=Tarenaya hassleriana TaxID=28532 RepID=UPI00053C4D5A|nr:PREDICTED: cyclin-T1-3-like isoform X2 [Tarenaya hassleriana]